MINRLLLLAFWLALPLAGFGQESISLSLSEALDHALKKSDQLIMAVENYQASKADATGANAVFLPQLKVEHNLMRTNNPLNAFGFKLLQENVTNADFNPALLNDPDAITNAQTNVTLAQPLLQMSGWNKRSAAQLKAEGEEFMVERTKAQLQFQVKQAYWGLWLARQKIAAVDSAKILMQRMAQDVQNFMDEGIVNEADFLEIQARVIDLNAQLEQARNDAAFAQDGLSILIGKQVNTSITLTERLSLPDSPSLSFTSIMSERNDLKAIKAYVQASEAMVTANQFDYIPQINGFATYQWNQDTWPGFDASNYMIGLQLSWNVFSGMQRVGAIQKAKAERNKTMAMNRAATSQAQMEINAAIRSIHSAELELQYAKEQLLATKRQLGIRKDRFDQGLEKVSDVLRSEVQFTQATLKKHAATVQVLLAQANYELATETTLD